MSKLTLLTHENDLTSFNADFLMPIYEKHFNIEFFDADKTYDKKNTIIINGLFRNSSWSSHLHDFKTVIDNLAEIKKDASTDNKLYLTCKNWFWYHESLWYSHLGFDNYVPNKTYEKLALMPMRLEHTHRKLLFNKVQPFLNDFIYSFVARGITLPEDLLDNNDVFQRNFNPKWYDSTYFSLVSETFVESNVMFVTEKTFKTFAYSHPSLIFGITGTLKFLQSLGFETYSNLFDESYDNKNNLIDRLNCICDNIKNFVKTPYDKLTLQKIEHNKNLFYNKQIVEQQIIKEIIEPIYEYAET